MRFILSFISDRQCICCDYVRFADELHNSIHDEAANVGLDVTYCPR